MSNHESIVIAARLVVLGALVSTAGHAQKPPAIRQLLALERSSTEPLASAATALGMPGGRVLVNDLTGRRLLLLDSTLTHATIVADTTGGTSQGYGQGASSLIRYRGDTALLINPNSLSMFVIGPAGTIARVMAIPRPNDAGSLYGLNGAPGFDARGRLVYFAAGGSLPGVLMLVPGDEVGNDNEIVAVPYRRAIAAGIIGPSNQHIDSAFLVRADMATRSVDTAASVKIPKANRALKADAQHLLKVIETTPDPLPVVDAWAMLPDGSLAVVRGRDYHVDWLDAGGHWTSSPKIPFDWQRLTDERKQTLIDSAVADWQATFDRVAKGRLGGGGGGGAGTSGGRGGGGGGPGRSIETAPNIAVRPDLGALPTYVPPFEWSFSAYPVQADADGNLWIRTTAVVQGRPVYDVVNRRGELIDRIQLPSFRTIAGFGPGVVYMAMKDAAGAVHLERARVK